MTSTSPRPAPHAAHLGKVRSPGRSLCRAWQPLSTRGRLLRGLALGLPLLLAACASPSSQDSARYDLGGGEPAQSSPPLPIASVHVDAAPWLNDTRIAYRLDYASPERRDAYAQARWLAPPAQLLERELRRGAARHTAANAACHLHLTLIDLEQRFSDPQHSAVQLEVQLELRAANTPERIAGGSLSVSEAAATPDAPGGVRATRAAAQTLRRQLLVWLRERHDRDTSLRARCTLPAAPIPHPAPGDKP